MGRRRREYWKDGEERILGEEDDWEGNERNRKGMGKRIEEEDRSEGEEIDWEEERKIEGRRIGE